MDGIGSRPRLRATGASDRSDGRPSLSDRKCSGCSVRAGRCGRLAARRDADRPDCRRASSRTWRTGLRPAGPDRSWRGCAVGAACAAGSPASTAQSGADQVNPEQFFDAAAGRLLRYGIPSHTWAVGRPLCHSPSAPRRGHSPLWIPRPFLRVCGKGPCAGCSRDREGPGDRRPSRQRRFDVCAERWAQRRKYHGVHCSRWVADGNASGTNRPRCHPVPHGREGHVGDERAEFPLSGLRLERAVRHQQ